MDLDIKTALSILVNNPETEFNLSVLECKPDKKLSSKYGSYSDPCIMSPHIKFFSVSFDKLSQFLFK